MFLEPPNDAFGGSVYLSEAWCVSLGGVSLFECADARPGAAEARETHWEVGMSQIRLWVVGALVLFGLALAFGVAADANAQVQDGAEIVVAESGGLAVEVGESPDHRRLPIRRLPRLRKIIQCQRIAVAVHRACPCEGVDGVAWKDHEEFVDCVKDKLDLIAAEHENAPEACLARILDRAEKSRIGDPDFTCPERKSRPAPGEPRDPGEPPGGGETP